MKAEGIKLEKYQVLTQRTLPDLGSEQLNVLHMILGMGSEFNELYQATDDINRAEEITDILWYVSNYSNMKGIKLNKIFGFQKGLYFYALEDNDYIEMLQVEISKLTDIEKKTFAYKKSIPDIEREICVEMILKRINDCYSAFNLDPELAMEKNINKLIARYPEKFSEELANNRNLEIERNILEGK